MQPAYNPPNKGTTPFIVGRQFIFIVGERVSCYFIPKIGERIPIDFATWQEIIDKRRCRQRGLNYSMFGYATGLDFSH